MRCFSSCMATRRHRSDALQLSNPAGLSPLEGLRIAKPSAPQPVHAYQRGRRSGAARLAWVAAASSAGVAGGSRSKWLAGFRPGVALVAGGRYFAGKRMGAVLRRFQPDGSMRRVSLVTCPRDKGPRAVISWLRASRRGGPGLMRAFRSGSVLWPAWEPGLPWTTTFSRPLPLAQPALTLFFSFQRVPAASCCCFPVHRQRQGLLPGWPAGQRKPPVRGRD